jgi:hypothetical protein
MEGRGRKREKGKERERDREGGGNDDGFEESHFYARACFSSFHFSNNPYGSTR